MCSTYLGSYLIQLYTAVCTYCRYLGTAVYTRVYTSRATVCTQSCTPGRYCAFAYFALVVTQKFSFSKILEVVSRPEFAQDHESGLRSDRGLVLCDFSKLRFWNSPYDFLSLCGRFCPYSRPYEPGNDTSTTRKQNWTLTQKVRWPKFRFGTIITLSIF